MNLHEEWLSRPRAFNADFFFVENDESSLQVQHEEGIVETEHTHTDDTLTERQRGNDAAEATLSHRQRLQWKQEEEETSSED